MVLETKKEKSKNPKNVNKYYNNNIEVPKLSKNPRIKSSKFNNNIKQKHDTAYNCQNDAPKNFISNNQNTTKLTLLQQNIQGLNSKIDEFLISLPSKTPQIICLTEHQLTKEQISNINLGEYILGAASSRQLLKYGGTCIYVSKDIEFTIINLEQTNQEKDIETCALKIHLASCSFIIMCMYRAPTGNTLYFLNQ